MSTSDRVTKFDNLIKSLNKIIFGNENEDVILDGVTKPTWSKWLMSRSLIINNKADKSYVDNVLSQFQSGSSKFYATLADANADIANIMPKLTTDTVKDLVNVGEVANGGTWYKANSSATSLTKSPYDSLVQSQKYTDMGNKKRNELRDQGISDTATQSRILGDSKIVPLVTDEQGSIVLGFNTVEKKLFFENGVDDYSAGFSGLKAFSSDSDEMLPIVTDLVGNVVLGYSLQENKLIGEFPESYTGQASSEAFPYPMVANNWNQAIVYGQSLSDGATGSPALSTTQPQANITFGGGVRSRSGVGIDSFKPMVETSVETITSGLSNYAVKRAVEKNGVSAQSHKIFGSACGAGGYRIDMLSKGSAWWTNQFLPHCHGATALNPDTTIQCVAWLQGEANSGDGNPVYTPRLGYKNALKQLTDEINAEAQTTTGQNTPVIMLCYQHSTYAKVNNGGTQLATLDLCAEDDRVYFVAPTYAFPHHTDNLHLTNVGYKWLGAYFGRAYHQMMFEKIKPLSIKPISATYLNNTILVNFEVPYSPLHLNTSILPKTENYGFCVKKGNGDIVPISNVSIKNGSSVLIECGEVISEAVFIRYALDYDSLNLKGGATGNLFDSCKETVLINGIDKPMFYVCPHFEISAYNGAV